MFLQTLQRPHETENVRTFDQLLSRDVIPAVVNRNKICIVQVQRGGRQGRDVRGEDGGSPMDTLPQFVCEGKRTGTHYTLGEPLSCEPDFGVLSDVVWTELQHITHERVQQFLDFRTPP